MNSRWQISFFVFRFLQLSFAVAVLAFHSAGYSGLQTYSSLVIDNGLEPDFTPNVFYFLWFIVAAISIIASIGLCFVTLARSHRHTSTPSERKLAILMSILWLVFIVAIMVIDGGIRNSTVVQVDDDTIQAAEAYVFWCWNFTCGFAIVTLIFWISGVCCMYLWVLIGSRRDRFIAEEDSDIYSPWRIPGGSTPPLSSPSSRMASSASLDRIVPMAVAGSRSYKNPREYKTPRQVARLSMVSQQGSTPRPVSMVSVESNLNELITVRDGSIHSASSSPVLGNPPSPNQGLAKSRRSSAPVLSQLANPSQDEIVSVEIMSEAVPVEIISEAPDGKKAAQQQEQLEEQQQERLSRLVVPQQDESVSVEVVTEMAGTEVIHQQQPEMVEVTQQEEVLLENQK